MDERLQRELEHDRKIAEKAESVWGWSSPAGRIRAERRANLLIKYAELDASKRVLELGCGTGIFTQLLSQTNAQLTALDLSTALLSEISCEQVSRYAANAERLPFADNSFDAVVGSSVLHHLRCEPALAEIKRVLKHGGKIAFAEPNMLNPQIMLQKNIPWLKEKMGDSPDETAFFRWQIATLLTNAGFLNSKAMPHDFLHPLIPASWIPVLKKISQTLEKTPLVREIAGSLLITAEKK
jgi:ubiquinone/menaquinone biosynthesis C-methylase UbiE